MSLCIQGGIREVSDMLYTIDQVAQRVGVTKGTLRYWEVFYRVIPERSGGNHRRYSQTQLDVMLQIKALREEGFNGRGIKARLLSEGVV